MPKYAFIATQYLRIEIVADSEDEAFRIAVETPFKKWKEDGAEIELDLDGQEGEED